MLYSRVNKKGKEGFKGLKLGFLLFDYQGITTRYIVGQASETVSQSLIRQVKSRHTCLLLILNS